MTRTPRLSMAKGGGFAAAVLVIMFSEQAFLNAGPLIIRGLQGAAAAGFIFNVLMIARAPLQLFQAVSTSILPHLTSLHTSDEPDSERRVPPLGADGAARHRRLHRPRRARRPDRRAAADADRLQQQVHLRPRRACCWSRSAWASTSPRSRSTRPASPRARCGGPRRAGSPAPPSSSAGTSCRWSATSSAGSRSASLLAAGVLFALLYLVYRRPHERAEDVPEPGSPEELEARLASIDENV